MRSTIRTRVIVVGAVAALSALAVGQAAGGILAGDGNGMDGWRGSKYFDTANQPIGMTLFAADIEYCVYDQGKFTQTPEFSGETVDPDHYVYAYQIAEVYDGIYGPGSGYVSQFSVGLTGLDEQATNIGYVDGTGISPTSSALITGTAKWLFNPGVFNSNNTILMPPAPSAVLYYTSLFAPEWDNATATGALFDTQLMPSPTPEPTMMALLGLGAAALLRTRKRRG